MSRKRDVLTTNVILLGLSIFLCTSPLAAALTGTSGVLRPSDGAERILASVTGVVAEISADGREVEVSWNLHPNDFVRRSPAGSDFTTGGGFINVNDVARYTIYRSTDGAQPTSLDTVSAGQTSFVDRTLTLGATYTYLVAAVSSGSGQESTPAEADAPVDLGGPPGYPGLTLEVDLKSLNEDSGNPSVTVTATLDRPWSLETPVVLEISGTAEGAEGRDYTATWPEGQTITIAAGATAASTLLTLAVNDDNLAEGDVPETIVVEGTSEVSGGAGDATETLDVDNEEAEIELTDNDVAPEAITITLDQNQVPENLESVDVVDIMVTATLGDNNTALLEDTIVELELSGTEELLGPDYSYLLDPGEILIPAEATSGEAILSLSPVNDILDEGDETINVTGTVASENSEQFTTVNQAMIKLVDDDVVQTYITLRVDNTSFNEGTGGEMTVRAELGDLSAALLTGTTVELSVAESEDNAPLEGSVTIEAGMTSGEVTLSLSPVNDILDEEDNESIPSLIGSATGFDIDPVELTVADDDVVQTYITLRVDNTSFNEGTGGEMTVRAELGDLSAALLTDTTVELSVAESEDNAPLEGSVTIEAGMTSGEVTLSLSPVNDILDEEDNESIPSLIGSATGFDIDPVELTVADDDVVQTYITLRVDNTSFNEGTGGEMTVRAELGDLSAALLTDTTVELSVAESEDNAPLEGPVTIRAGDTSGEVTLSLSPVNDILDEEDNESIPPLVGSAEGFDIDPVELWVTDDDEVLPYITLSVNEDRFDEGTGGEMTVKAVLGNGSAALLTDTTVELSVAESEDNAPAAATLTIEAGETEGTTSLSLSPVNDILDEMDETIALEGSAEGFEIASVELTVADDDVVQTYITLSVDNTSFGEGTEDQITVTAELGDLKAALLTDTTVELSVAESEDNASSTADLIIEAGKTSGEATLSLTFIEDNLVDGNKTIELKGAAEGYRIDAVELTVEDNDEVLPTITLDVVDNTSFNEGDTPTLTVTAQLGDGSTALLNDTEVTLWVAGSADIDAARETLIIAARGTEGRATISLSPVDDNLVEEVETIALEGTALGFTIDPVELTLTDNDEAPGTIHLSVENSSFHEGTDVTVEVTAVLGNGEILLLTETEVSLSVEGSADNGASATTLTIAAEQASGTVGLPLSLLADDLVEDPETILLMGEAAGYQIAPVELTVHDMTKRPTTITLSVNPSSLDEGDGETRVEVTALLGDGGTALQNEDTEITLSLSGTAEEGTDYSASIPTITIAAGTTEISEPLILTPPAEVIPEYDETIVVEGSADGFTVASTTIILTDNDDEPTVVAPIPAMTLYAGGADGVVELSDKFRGLDLTYGATSSNPGVATVSVAGSEATVKAVIEGESTITVVAKGSVGPDASQTFVVTVLTEANEVAVLGDALAAIGRGTLSSVSSAIGTRFGSRPAAPVSATLAGYSLLGGNESSHLMAAQGFGLEGNIRYPQGLGSLDGLSWKRILQNSSFAVPMGSGDAEQELASWMLWGLGDYQAFEGTPDYGSHDGTLTTVYLGADKRLAARGQAGVSVSYSMGEANYSFSGDGASGDGTLTTVLTSVYPYLRWAPTSGMDIWALGGVGVGTAENERGVTSTMEESDLSMSLGLLGARQALGTMGGLDMALRGDVGIVNLSTAEGEEILDDHEVAGQRFRLGLEGARTLVIAASCATLTPFGELSGRFDGGDGQTGGGLEVAGGMRYKCARSRFQLEARGRILALNSAYEERGGSIMASLSPKRDGLGLSMSVAPRWGAADRGAQALWREDTLQTGRFGLSPNDWSMDALVGYSMRVRPLQGILTPFAEFGPVSADRSLTRLGFRLAGFSGTAFEMLDLNFSGGRVKRDQQTAEHRIDVRGAVRF